MGVPETDPLAQLRCRRLELKDSAKMQRAEPPPPPQTVTVLLVAIDGDTQSRIIDQLPPPHYQLVASSTPNLALHLLVDEKLHVDLVLSSVSSKDDEEGYNFIAQVQRLRKNIPHVVIFEAEGSGDPEIIRVNKLGVCYILWKPVSEQSSEIKNLRQHVFRRNEGSSSLVSFPQKSLKKENDQQPSEKEPESSKKQRMVWDKELNTLFVKAVNELGDGK
ncbi:hypothetical protein QN277_029376 [Acacia crassicarpa]|uniref:Response regulatory domain-containing protein n=1 Tax=Acacia crassicarpa TaxID=499986 RepID=A0AAE1K4S9_9FABA|nr:hypothetical protein QN277_029376 [Acacia crassicarpa]